MMTTRILKRQHLMWKREEASRACCWQLVATGINNERSVDGGPAIIPSFKTLFFFSDALIFVFDNTDGMLSSFRINFRC